MLQICTGLAISTAAAGCGSTGTVTRPASPLLVASEQALALPPPGGPAIVGVVERQRGNGVEQTISLATSSKVQGQNYLTIQFFGADVSSGQSAPFRTIRERDLTREMAAAVPGVRMSRSLTFLQNSYGPFAYAAGRSAFGDTCIFAWQQIRAGATSNGIGRDFGMIQVRLRICDAHATEEQLLSAAYGYTITGTFDGVQWNPFGEPSPADPRLGRTGQPIYPSAGASVGSLPMGYAGGVDLTRTSPVVRRSTPQIVERSSVAPTAEKANSGPRVPLPGGTSVPAAVPSASAQPRQNTTAPAVTVPSPEGFLPPKP